MADDSQNIPFTGDPAYSLTPAEQDTQFIAIGTDTSTNPKFSSKYKLKQGGPTTWVLTGVTGLPMGPATLPTLQGIAGNFPWALIHGTMADSARAAVVTLTDSEASALTNKDTGNVNDIGGFTVTRTLDASDFDKGPLANPPWTPAFPITIEITSSGPGLELEPEDPLELQTSNKTVIGAINEIITDDVGPVQNTVSNIEKATLYEAIGNYLAHDKNNPMSPLNRLNQIPVLSADKILSFVDGDGTDHFPVNDIYPGSPVNLLEATWTIWKSLANINTEMFGISATNMPELSATALVSSLSGKNVRENLNFIYNTLQTCCSGGIASIPSLSALSACCDTNAQSITGLQDQIFNITNIQSLSSLIQTLCAVDTVTIVNQLSALKQDLSILDEIQIKLADYDIRITDNEGCCDTNRTDIQVLSARLMNLNTGALSGIKNIFDGIDLYTYINKLSALEIKINQLEDITTYINTINTNETDITNISGDIENIYNTIQNISVLDIPALSGIIENAKNIYNIQILLDYLSAGTKFQELEECCNLNATNITNLEGDIITNRADIAHNTTNINILSGSLTDIPGVVKTTTNQSVSGEKTFKNTLTVSASSYFEDNVTLGDTSQPKIFNVCSNDGVTTVNITGLPTSTAGLQPGDLYITDINGTSVIAIHTT